MPFKPYHKLTVSHPLFALRVNTVPMLVKKEEPGLGGSVVLQELLHKQTVAFLQPPAFRTEQGFTLCAQNVSSTVFAADGCLAFKCVNYPQGV